MHQLRLICAVCYLLSYAVYDQRQHLTAFHVRLCREFYVGGGSNADDFYTLASARQAYKNHLKVVTSRKNTVNGKVRSLLAASSGALGLLLKFYTRLASHMTSALKAVRWAGINLSVVYMCTVLPDAIACSSCRSTGKIL